MAVKEIDLALVYKQLEHLEKEIQFIKWELAQVTPASENISPEIDETWDALQEAKGIWEREWDADWEAVWNKS
jgi:chromosome segregation ATPase